MEKRRDIQTRYRGSFEERSCAKRYLRERQLRQRMTAFVILSAVLLSGLGFGFLSSAQEESRAVSYKYFTSVLVRSGDTLTSIAHTYADHHYESLEAYVREVRETNHLMDADEIRAGDYLIVPYYSGEFK
ncbi:MAG: LysM peptidoglycan-binding domain-containing protein [Eubacteriales bacterium]|nr:LysM peptidoglycan-binding domain-containing protein [Eubacteriales bacterium]